jgi:hypothetical protein
LTIAILGRSLPAAIRLRSAALGRRLAVSTLAGGLGTTAIALSSEGYIQEKSNDGGERQRIDWDATPPGVRPLDATKCTFAHIQPFNPLRKLDFTGFLNVGGIYPNHKSIGAIDGELKIPPSSAMRSNQHLQNPKPFIFRLATWKANSQCKETNHRDEKNILLSILPSACRVQSRTQVGWSRPGLLDNAVSGARVQIRI